MKFTLIARFFPRIVQSEIDMPVSLKIEVLGGAALLHHPKLSEPVALVPGQAVEIIGWISEINRVTPE